MIYRIAFCIIPMIVGALLFSGAIPIRSLIFGGGATAPAHGLPAGTKAPPGEAAIAAASSPIEMMAHAARTERMMREAEREFRPVRSSMGNSSHAAAQGRPDWAPQGGWAAGDSAR